LVKPLSKEYPDIRELLERVEELEKRLEEKAPSPPKREAPKSVKAPPSEVVECPTCGSLTTASRIEERAGKPFLVREREVVREVPKEVVKKETVTKEVPVKLNFRNLMEKAGIKPKSLSPETGEVIKKLYETGRKEGWVE